jgi:D-arabinose 1-dehydrogenase-like Zn-dependent alcohol dehydrogenase
MSSEGTLCPCPFWQQLGGGHIALIGIMDRPTTTISILAAMGKTLRLQGVSVGSRDDMGNLLAFVEQHRISPIIDADTVSAHFPMPAITSIAVHLAKSS